MAENTTKPEGGQAATVKAEDLFEPHMLAQYDPEVVKYVVQTAQEGVLPQHMVPIEEVRADPAKFTPPWALDTKGWPRVVEDEFVSSEENGGSFPVRIYYPDPDVWGDGPYGVHLNFHGGGFVFGNLSSESSLCMSMCDGAGVVVIDVNYRHCPETPWGECIQDAWATLKRANEAPILNTKSDSISISGISAGGQIAVVLQHLARDAGIPLRLCMPTVPATSAWLGYQDYTDSPHRSFHEFARGPVLPWARIQYFRDCCLPAGGIEELRTKWPAWWIAPLQAPNWKGLCETFIRTGEVDPLRDEGEEYGAKLIAGGNKVTIKRYLGSPHMFAFYPWYKKKQEFDKESIAALRQAHATR